uniref:Uncharacterized protein n=1 Tax=Anguilla anguilla TaxID=7936 RepID=A0A0E9T5B6_ANGAN
MELNKKANVHSIIYLHRYVVDS